jgi:hypothetical protein
MKDPGLVILGVVAFGFVFVVLPVALMAFGRYRQPREIVCPEAACGARVSVDTRFAALTAALGKLRLKVAGCSLWPSRRGCAEACLKGPGFED